MARVKPQPWKCLEGVRQPSSGQIHFRGQPLDASYPQKIGVMFQTTALPDYLNVQETLALFAGLYPQSADLGQLITHCQLQEFLTQDVQQLSGGQRQRLLLALALINRPQIVFLDEPSTGLDPKSRRAIWQLLEAIKESGCAIVLTTHYMEEAETLCDQVLILAQGKVVASGAPKQLLESKLTGRVLEFPTHLSGADRLLALGAKPTPEGFEFFCRDANADFAALLGAGIDLRQLRMREPSLEDLFFAVTRTQAEAS